MCSPHEVFIVDIFIFHSFVAFKYMILYPIIQLISALRLYAGGSVLGDLQYLWADVWLVLPLAVFSMYFISILFTCKWAGPAPKKNFRSEFHLLLYSIQRLLFLLLDKSSLILEELSWYLFIFLLK